MKMRLIPPVAAQGAWLIAGRSAAGAVLLALAVSACTGGGSSAPVFTPTPQTSGQASSTHPATRTPSPSGGASSTATASAGPGSKSPTARPSETASARASKSPTAKPTPRVTPTKKAPTKAAVTPTPLYPTAAPQTGGGGTAGLQDGLLLGVGGAAVFAGLGSLAYRRRLRRKFAPGRRPAPRDPADREPADR